MEKYEAANGMADVKKREKGEREEALSDVLAALEVVVVAAVVVVFGISINRHVLGG